MRAGKEQPSNDIDTREGGVAFMESSTVGSSRRGGYDQDNRTSDNCANKHIGHLSVAESYTRTVPLVFSIVVK